MNPKPKVVLVVGVSGSGKSWVCRQLTDKYHYLPHDRCWTHPHAKPKEGIDVEWGPKGCQSTHLPSIIEEASKADRPLITEVPFGERKLREDLQNAGMHVTVVFVIEDPEIVAKRYLARERRPLAKAALSRAKSIVERAKEWRAFYGTSAEVLSHLRDLKFTDRMTSQEWRAFNRK